MSTHNICFHGEISKYLSDKCYAVGQSGFNLTAIQPTFLTLHGPADV